MYPLVRELAVDGIPVTVSCRVLDVARQPYYRWLQNPFTDAQLDEAYLANAIFDAHRDDPEFGYRFLADEVRHIVEFSGVSDRVVWRICRDHQWWSVFGKKKRSKAAKAGAPSHDDLVKRDFTATAPNQLWLSDITWSPRSKWPPPGEVTSRFAFCTPIADRSFALGRFTGRSPVTAWSDPWATSAQPATTPPWNRFFPAAEERPRSAHLDDSRRAANRDRHLDRTHLPPPTTTEPPRPIDPHRIRDHHDPSDGTRRLTTRCHLNARQTLDLDGEAPQRYRRHTQADRHR